jgi:glycosyltransferase involved in cell wall biosynthesis
MIVKDESKAIARCLESVKPIISHWVIVDTGSTDDTKAIIQDVLKDIPGKLYDRKWVNFAHNRNQALKLAKDKGDYVLFMDADDALEFSKNFVLPELEEDCYLLANEGQGLRYWKAQLVNNALDWQWEGVIHENLKLPPDRIKKPLKDVIIHHNVLRAGSRSQSSKTFNKDVKILKARLKKEPDNARYQFYLASTYNSAGKQQLALENYEKRVLMGGADTEVFWSLLQIGILNDALNMPASISLKSYQLANKLLPSRAEPLYYISRQHMNNKEYLLSFMTALQGLTIPEPIDSMFTYHWIYEYGLYLQLATSAYLLEKYQEANSIFTVILTITTLPPQVREWVKTQLTNITELLKNKLETQR